MTPVPRGLPRTLGARRRAGRGAGTAGGGRRRRTPLATGRRRPSWCPEAGTGDEGHGGRDVIVGTDRQRHHLRPRRGRPHLRRRRGRPGAGAGGATTGVDGEGGDDIIFGNLGQRHPLRRGRQRSDLGDAGRDTVDGGTGPDVLYGGGGPDTLDGGTETDKLYGEAGRDRLYGGDGRRRTAGGHRGRHAVRRRRRRLPVGGRRRRHAHRRRGRRPAAGRAGGRQPPGAGRLRRVVGRRVWGTRRSGELPRGPLRSAGRRPGHRPRRHLHRRAGRRRLQQGPGLAGGLRHSAGRATGAPWDSGAAEEWCGRSSSRRSRSGPTSSDRRRTRRTLPTAPAGRDRARQADRRLREPGGHLPDDALHARRGRPSMASSSTSRSTGRGGPKRPGTPGPASSTPWPTPGWPPGWWRRTSSTSGMTRTASAIVSPGTTGRATRRLITTTRTSGGVTP